MATSQERAELEALAKSWDDAAMNGLRHPPEEARLLRSNATMLRKTISSWPATCSQVLRIGNREFPNVPPAAISCMLPTEHGGPHKSQMTDTLGRERTDIAITWTSGPFLQPMLQP